MVDPVQYPLGLFRKSVYENIYGDVPAFDLGIPQCKGYDNGPHEPHQLVSSPDRHPEKTREDVCTGQNDHRDQRNTGDKDKRVVYVVGDSIRLK